MWQGNDAEAQIVKIDHRVEKRGCGTFHVLTAPDGTTREIQEQSMAKGCGIGWSVFAAIPLFVSASLGAVSQQCDTDSCSSNALTWMLAVGLYGAGQLAAGFFCIRQGNHGINKIVEQNMQEMRAAYSKSQLSTQFQM